MNNTGRINKKSYFMHILRGFMAGLLVLCCFLPNIVRSEGEGLAQINVLRSLGIISDDISLEPGDDISVTGFRNLILSMLGCGDKTQAAEFYRDFSPELYPDISAGSQDLTGTEAYKMLLTGLGYDISGVEDSDIVLLASSSGFGFIKDAAEVADSGKISFGTASIILYEALFTRQIYTNKPLYLTLGQRDSAFLEKLLSLGLFDDIPESIIPRFTGGMYVAGSFSCLPGENGQTEWSSSYRNVTSAQIAEYISELIGLGWLSEGQYAITDQETGAESTLWLLYTSQSQGKETGIVLSYDGSVLTWTLLKE